MRTWQLIGGNLALDLCNTVSWRLDPARRVDRIATPSEFDAWFQAVIKEFGPGQTPPTREEQVSEAERLRSEDAPTPHASQGGPAQTPPTRGEHVSDGEKLSTDAALLLQIHELRDALTQVLDGDGNTEEPLRIVLNAWRQALTGAEPQSGLPLSFTIEPRMPTDVPHFLALAAGELLQDQIIGRLRRCEGRGCGWLFLDTTRNHSRRWCDPADCGNRERVRAYGQRRRAAKTAEPAATTAEPASATARG